MKHILLSKPGITSLIFLVATGFIFKTAYTSESGVAGRSGSPNETTCNTTNCHNNFTLNSGGGSVSITSPDLTNWEYLPATLYNIDVTVSKTGATQFGFALESLWSNGTNAGTLVVTNSASTQLKNATILGNSRTSMTHKTNAGTANDTKTFSFRWTSPATTVGNLTFYVAGNATNNDNHATGDYIYTSNQVIIPNIGAAVNNIEVKKIDFNVYPNPLKDYLNLCFTNKEKQNVKIEIYDLSGRFMELLLLQELPAGIHNYYFDIKNQLAPGLYVVRMEQNTNVGFKKIMVNP